MISLSPEQVKSREKTLLFALLLSMWAPIATGIAVLMSRSSTQVADFCRRSVELAALFVSWSVFRYIYRREPAPEVRVRLERAAGLCVAAALGSSGVIMLVLAGYRFSTSFLPGGNVYPGLAIAVLGVITNSWFWRRYTFLNREHPNSIIDAQRRLYRAKAFVDICVICALSSVALFPSRFITRYVDLTGTVVVSVYLIWSGIRSAKSSLAAEATLPSSRVLEQHE